jgi:hypothetical protein
MVGSAVLQSQLWWLTSPSRAKSTWVLGYVPTCCIASVSATVTVQSTSPRHVGLGALHLGNHLRSSGRATDDPPPCLHLTTISPSHPSYNGCTYPPRMPTSPRRSARPNPASCFSYRHLDSLKASTARCTSDRSINFSHARLPDGHTSFSTCLSSLDAQPPFGYLRPTPHTHLTSSRRLSSM